MIEILILGMATWRVSSLFVREDGPWFIFRKIREAVGISHDGWGKIFAVPDTLAAGMLSCLWCCSVWVGGAWALAYFFYPLIAYKLAIAFALSTAAILLDTWIQVKDA